MLLLTAVGRFAKGDPFKFALRVSIPAQAEERGQTCNYCFTAACNSCLSPDGTFGITPY